MPTVSANGTMLHYRFDGPEDGPVVMLSHSLAVNLDMWEPQVPVLTGAGFRVLRYDRRGHGRSPAPPGPYTIEQLAADAVGLLDAPGLQRVHFCGLSLGGAEGQTLGAHHGERFITVTLCDTAPQMAPRETWDQSIEAVRARGIGALADGFIDRGFTQAGRQRLRDTVQLVREMILGTDVEGFCGCCAAIRDMDQRESVRAIATPTHLIVGERDARTPVAAAEFLHQRIPGSGLTVIPDAAHLCNLEQPEAFNAALLAHLQRHG